MIPKKIHYCWFGGKPLPPLAKRCIASWKKYFPDYEIIEWNENNYDVNKIPYIKEAYAAKKYAFVSDYARFDILYEHGGIYFDTDVEVIRDMSDLIQKGNFAGIEAVSGGLAAGLGIAAQQRATIFEEILESYNKSSFIKPDGTMDLLTVVERVSNIFSKYGFKSNSTEVQYVADFYIYPSEYLCPKDIVNAQCIITPNTCSIHHYDGSWCSFPERCGMKIVWIITKVFGHSAGLVVSNLLRKAAKGLKKNNE